MSEKITLKRKDIEDAIKYIESASHNIRHINYALFNEKYKSQLDWNNQHDLQYIKMTLFLAVSSINRELTELEERLKGDAQIAGYIIADWASLSL